MARKLTRIKLVLKSTGMQAKVLGQKLPYKNKKH
jgi:hypothetical protein